MNHTARLHFTISLLLAFLLASIAGCAGTGRYALNPRITLADIRIMEIKTLESAFQIELRILNPNDIPLEVNGLECRLRIDGKEFAAGVTGDHHLIPAYGSAIVPVTVYASMLDMVSSVIAIAQDSGTTQRRREPLRYQLSGHVLLGEKNLWRKTIPFATEGELSFTSMQ
ncbi:MAG: LEA type 2 family protein [Desulfobulbaceae bacterium]|nr:LEA type 2 family protein [Desulfobulbaceae bacterium]